VGRVLLVDKVNGKPSMVIGKMDPREPGRGEVRYRVHAIGINRSDLMFLEGGHYALTNYPSRVASEACGVVDAVGEGVTEFKIGDRVSAIPYIDPAYYVGGEWAITFAHYLAPWPEHVPAAEACAFWMQYITGYFPFCVYSHLGPGNTALVAAAGSSAGIAAIHLARLRGAQVIATTRTPAKAQRLKEQGANHVVIPGEENLAARILEITGGRGIDLAYDPIAGEFTDTYTEALATGAKIFIYGMLGGRPRVEYSLIPVSRSDATVQHYLAPMPLRDPNLLAEAKLFLTLAQQAGRLRPVVDRIFDFEDFEAAYDYMRSGRQFGKIVLKMPGAD
jgi:NADPH:quinone reductase-like Zn-dependent oxidoreductase